MYTTSNEYKLNIYKPSTKHLLKVFIDNVEVQGKYILDFKLSQQLFSNDEFTLGTVSSRAVELKLYKTAVPENINRIYIESGIDGECVPIGYFNVDNMSKDDDYTVTLNLLDDMVKFEFSYDGSQLFNGNQSATILEVLQDICSKAEVELRFYFFFKHEQTNICI